MSFSRFWCCSQCCSPVLFQVWPSLNVSTFLIVSKFCTSGVLPHCDVQMLKEINCIKETQTRSTLILCFFSDPTPLWSKRPIQSNIAVSKRNENIVASVSLVPLLSQSCRWVAVRIRSSPAVLRCQCVADAIQVVDFISVITNCVKYGSLLTDPFLQTI